MGNVGNLSQLILQSGSFIAAFAAISAAVLMLTIRKKIGSGILAAGFTIIAVGVLFVAIGIILDAATIYVVQAQSLVFTSFVFAKNILFIAGTYAIVIGSKRIRDNLASLAK